MPERAVWGDITRADYRKARRSTADACLLAVVLKRTYGGEWLIAGSEATQVRGRHTTWSGQTTLQAQRIMNQFDRSGAAPARRHVKIATSAGPPPVLKGSGGTVRPSSRPKGSLDVKVLAGAFGLAATGLLVVAGLLWLVVVLIIAAGMGISALGLLGGWEGARDRLAKVPAAAPSPSTVTDTTTWEPFHAEPATDRRGPDGAGAPVHARPGPEVRGVRGTPDVRPQWPGRQRVHVHERRGEPDQEAARGPGVHGPLQQKPVARHWPQRPARGPAGPGAAGSTPAGGRATGPERG